MARDIDAKTHLELTDIVNLSHCSNVTVNLWNTAESELLLKPKT